jgi:DNA-binding MarR family transcriptional regulator
MEPQLDLPDLAPLGLQGVPLKVLTAVLSLPGQSTTAIAASLDLDPSVVSRAVKRLEERGVLQRADGRSAPVTLSPHVASTLRAEATQLAAAAAARASRIEDLAERLQACAPPSTAELPPYWLVPLSANALDLENEVRRVGCRFDAAVPAGARPRGVPHRTAPHVTVKWRLLLERPPSKPPWTAPGRTDIEIRVSGSPLVWLEVLDGSRCAVRLEVDGRPRTVWCLEPRHAAAAAAAFEWWWQNAAPIHA